MKRALAILALVALGVAAGFAGSVMAGVDFGVDMAMFGAGLPLLGLGVLGTLKIGSLQRVKLIKDFEADGRSFAKDTILEVDADTAKELIDGKYAEPYDPEADKKSAADLKAVDEARLKEIADAVRDVIQSTSIKIGDGEIREHKDGLHIVLGRDRRELDKMGGFKSHAHYLSEIVKAADAAKHGQAIPETLAKWSELCERLAKDTKAPTNIMQEGDDEQGGYLVPPDIAELWMPPVLESSISTGRAFNVPIRGSRIQMPALVDANHNANYFGGVIIYRPGEHEQKGTSKPNFRQIELRLHKMAVLVPVTDELISDSPVSMSALLNQVIPTALAFQQDADHINGTGAGMAFGAINALSPSLIPVAPRVGQPATTIIWENIVDMWSRFKMINPASCTWIANHDTFPQLATMAMAVGTGGVAVFLPAGGASGKPYATLMGLPLFLTEKCQTLGTQGDIGLIDWSQYYVANKGGVQVASSIHLWFDYDVTAFRFVLRSDGQPAWNTPLRPLISANTLSPFVVLQGRP